MKDFQNYQPLGFVMIILVSIFGCKNNASLPGNSLESRKNTGHLEFIDHQMEKFFDRDQSPEVLATGFEWSEGPVWVASHNMILFSDIPNNRVHKWTEENGLEIYLENAGYTGQEPRGGEMGSNGLAIDQKGRLLLCQHGDRSVSIMNADLNSPSPNYLPLTNRFNQLKYNSPNDLYIDINNNIYFTDPPYGLEGNVNDPLKEMDYQGVYRLNTDGNVELITDKITRPNGISLIRNESVLIVANSDPDDPKWYKFERLTGNGFGEPTVFHDATAALKIEEGLPDGLKWHPDGYLFATGPGGVWIFSGDGTLIGKIKTGRLTANCAFDENFDNLYMTADDALLRIKLKKA